jgi:hypothetical protein
VWSAPGLQKEVALYRYHTYMSIDERLERLTERHEALTQTVELMAAENQQRDRRLSEIMEGLARLLHIAEIHEHRLTNLEGGDAR